MRAAVLHRPGAAVTVEEVVLDPPKPGEVLVRVVAAGVCHSDVRYADGELGEGFWPIVLGHEGAGVVEQVGEGVTHVEPEDHVAFCFVPACRACRYCLAGKPNLCELVAEHGAKGMLMDGTSRLASRRRDDAPARPCARPASRSGQSSRRAAWCPSRASCRCGRPPCSGAASSPGWARCETPPACAPGTLSPVIGCGGVGLQVVAAARLAGAEPIVAVDRVAGEARARPRSGRDAPRRRLARRRSRHHDPRRSPAGGVDYAFEVIGRPETMRQAWGAIRSGGTAVVVGLAPEGVEASVPAIEFLSDKTLRGTYYGSGDPAAELPGLAGLALAGELDLAGVVTHFDTLDGVEAAFDRLRRGEGARTILVIDPATAGAPTLTDGGIPMTTISEGPRSVADAVAGLDIRARAFVDGGYVDALSGETFDCVSPITGEVVAQVAACESADVDRAVAGARAAFESGVWSRLAPKKRKRVLQKLAGLMSEHAEELALLETIDMGKPIRDATNVDVPLATECIAWYGEAIDKVYDEIAPTGPEAHVSIVREPLGVVGAVVPWNFPLMMASWKLGPALATGNSVVLKPAEQSPLTALRLAELASEAGLPDGVLQVVPGFGETAGQAIGRHPDVDMIAFTGLDRGRQALPALLGRVEHEARRARVRRQVAAHRDEGVRRPRCGRHGRRVGRLLQPGRGLQRGLAAARPLDGQGRAAREGRRRSRSASRRATRSTRRRGWARSSTRRSSTECSATSSPGKTEGAGLHLGGSRVREDTGGYYVEPTIFDAVSNDMRIAREEIFGPVLSSIAFDELDDAIAIANDTIYGLSAGIWTDDVNVAHRAARAIRAGVVWVNTFDAGDISSPFGGFKQSGFGRDKSIHALDKFTDLKAIWIALRD